MSVAELGSLGEFIASLGVFVTLIFLTFQMRQNTKAVRASMSSQMTTQWLTNSNVAVGNPDLVQLLMTVSPEDVSPPDPSPEGVRLSFWVSSVLKAAEFAHFQWQEGNLDTRLWQTNARGLYQISPDRRA